MKKNLQNRVHETSVSQVLSITGTVKELANAPSCCIVDVCTNCFHTHYRHSFYMNQSHTFTKACVFSTCLKITEHIQTVTLITYSVLQLLSDLDCA